jgi:hypothetical protein
MSANAPAHDAAAIAGPDESDDDIAFLRRELDALFARTKSCSLRAREWNERGHAILDRFAHISQAKGE